jgi:hypothetical protein
MYQSTSQAFKPTRLTIFARPVSIPLLHWQKPNSSFELRREWASNYMGKSRKTTLHFTNHEFNC